MGNYTSRKMKTCLVCAKKLGKWKHKYCSDKCAVVVARKANYYKPYIPKKKLCQVCTLPLLPKAWAQKYCSNKCRNTAAKKQRKDRTRVAYIKKELNERLDRIII